MIVIALASVAVLSFLGSREYTRRRDAERLKLLQLNAINAATQELIRKREPTHEEIQRWAIKHNVFVGTLDGAAGTLTKMGWVVLTQSQWDDVLKRLGMTRDEWLRRGE